MRSEKAKTKSGSIEARVSWYRARTAQAHSAEKVAENGALVSSSARFAEIIFTHRQLICAVSSGGSFLFSESKEPVPRRRPYYSLKRGGGEGAGERNNH